MKERNIYKDIVWAVLFCIIAAAAARWGREYARENRAYGFRIQAAEDLKTEIVEEFRKISGFCRFLPAKTAWVTIQIDTYTMQTEVIGVDIRQYPVKWEKMSGAQEEITVGNTPLLFFGKDAFTALEDQMGYAPLESKIEQWIQEYPTLTVSMTDENGQKRTAKICGILSQPENKIYMDHRQMREVFGTASHCNGGFLEIYGYKNTKKARGLLEDAGFITEDDRTFCRD